MSITTRRAELADTELLHDLAERTFGLACPPGTRQSDIDDFVATHLSAASFRGYLADPQRVLLLVLGDGVPLGYSMLVGGPIKDPDVAAVVDGNVSIELSKFYLAPERHGSGAAATLMEATLASAASAGAAFCWLGVNQQNVRAGKFYAKHGFEVIGVKRFLVGTEWHDDHIRRRPLP
ncbi:GNAT family N-acetyltransferase [Paractinoplanes hotanensis]|uniref:GNAT family N-acetyltransferase n=1 Tax=Paractinoplanes hotanensis TaxID=2906497 RepID=A0ABT0Y5E5_9ACTN|nr:GNAT family N-acetyltransferase [Actinoplanes hotanensis]MCM4080687.1 GNAT family N-acetyltransferase [Actinoplanes hotanensis]